MTDMAPDARFSIGSVIGRAFSIYFRNLASFIPLSLVAYIPIWLGIIFLGGAAAAGESAGPQAILSLLSMISGYWLQAALIYGTISTMRGHPASIGESFSKSLSALAGVVILGIVVGIIVGLGFLALVVPGIILSVMLFVAIPAKVVERGGIGASIRRSFELTKGHRWALFFLSLLMGVIIFAIAMGIGAVGGVGGAAMGAAQPVASAEWLWIENLAVMIVSGIWSTMSAVVYHDLRILKEGGGTEQIAAAFD